MKNTQYYLVAGWMLNELHLSGNKLLAYAIIYGICQDNSSVFKGNAVYVASCLGCTRECATKTLKALTEDGLIIKTDNGYLVNDNPLKNLDPSVKIFNNGSEKVSQFCEKNSQVCEKNSHEKYIYNNNINIPKEINKNNKLFLLKKGYGEFENVKLSKEELLKLAKKYKWRLGEAIARLDDYIEAKGDKYKSHYAVLKEQGWVWKDIFNTPDTNGKPKDILRLEDDNAPGGLRAETPIEYYTRVYKLDE